MIKIVSVILCALLTSFVVKAELLGQIVAVVEDEIILESELSKEVTVISQRLDENKVTAPPIPILRKQVLERLIVEKLQRQLAEKSGIRISNEMLRSSAQDIARRNDLTLDEFRQELEGQGIGFKSFQKNLKNEIIINQLRAREIGTRIKVTDREVAHYLETQGEIGEEKIQYHLGHILVSIPDAASSSIIAKALEKADTVIAELRGGAGFKQTAVAYSDGNNALKGGDLGWRVIGKVPTLFVDKVIKMNKGDVAELIRSPSGYHIIKLIDLKGIGKHIVTKTKVRHILIKTNELINDEDAKNRLKIIKERIKDGDDFAILARSNSDDKGSALKGGSLGWVGTGDLVPLFESTMKGLKINEISDPIQTEFGWHLIQVLERKNKDDSVAHKKARVRKEIRSQKIEEETELWLRRLRDEAFVNIKLERL
ncbi:MAG: peptidylprolyl isomerase [Methylococcales bacterium]|nr:peptidylprolyl isomerase [Methylococcales bacterium]